MLKRMVDRDFSEVDLRRMLHHARGLRVDIVEGRWIVSATHRGAVWEVILEPDASAEVIVVVTAYRLQP